jgi:hypothetical protein
MVHRRLQVTMMSKKQNLLTKFFVKNKSVESTVSDHETGLSDAASQEVSIENTDEGSKAERVNSKMLRSRSFRGSCMIPITTLCISIFAESQARIFRLYEFKIYSFNYFMFLYLQVLIVADRILLTGS